MNGITWAQAETILLRHQHELGVEMPTLMQVEPIGQGEANLNLLLQIAGGRKLNLRIGIRGNDSAAVLRRECWMLFSMYFDQIYHRTQLANDPHGHQAFTVNQLERCLLARFAG
ncbi:MAG: hypothetical protein HC822_21845 [Oscillochloris sp.]|nr:hypothetical protein [Oscillochloris sp.]